MEEERLAALKLEEEERKRHRQLVRWFFDFAVIYFCWMCYLREEQQHAEVLRQQMAEIKQREQEVTA